IVDFDTMTELACRDDCEARLVIRHGDSWTVEHGPFMRRRFSRLPARNWTLLVQGLECLVPAARQLLAHFDFIPYSRLDDLMVSYAPAGGGVGAHFDSYDVFLLQGPGQRRWQVSRQRDLSLVEQAPLKILERFQPEGQCQLSAGDMLYLPPAFAHDGVAMDACFTYSIGFRAPSHRELASEFLIFLEDKLVADGRYTDPDLLVQSQPARIGAAMLAKVARQLGKIRWDMSDVAEFLGSSLTEPKRQVLFSRPHKSMSARAFAGAARRRGIELALPSLMLYSRRMLFLNGEAYKTGASVPSELRRLANTRRLAGSQIPLHGPVLDLLYPWYRAGYIHVSKSGFVG
ncbi:MAG: cupin domain-containing protein, partial [Betaproteobacteria bacterium]